ncbi:MAG TPA: protein kinase [Vicinamibacterales bacterium]|nr:protein kinase [Vicinamibacterales bacterium]
MIGSSFSHYRVLQRLGEGATAVVYKAEDLALGRPVALKVLPETVSVDLGKIARFQHEARTASTLNHPNICTIYEIGEHEGRHFIAMEYLLGEPLSSLAAGRALPCYRLVEFAIQVADALDAAHAERIIHRDLKPANVYVTHRDHVKLLDFGLAVFMPIESDALQSAFWQAAPGGTVPYMSPEQTLAEPLDTRSDLFSLGVLLYEMATGARPFTGRTNAAVMEAIRQEHPFPARDLNTAVPDELNRIIEKALEKNRKLRYQTASDLGADLRRLKRDLDAQGRPAIRVPGPVGRESSDDKGVDHPGPAPVSPTPRRAWGIAQLVGACLVGFALAVFSASSSPDNTAAGPIAPATPNSTAARAVDDRRAARTDSTAAATSPVPASMPAPASRRGAAPAPRPTGNDAGGARQEPVTGADRQLDAARSKIDLKYYDQALATLADVVRTGGASASTEAALFMMGEVHEAQRDYDKAFSDYLDAATRFPESSRAPEALYGMARVILQSKRDDRAERAKAIYTDIASKHRSTVWAPKSLLARGQLEEHGKVWHWDTELNASAPVALGTYRALIAAYPTSVESPEALWRLSRLYSGIKRYDLAVSALTRLAERGSNAYDAWFVAAEIYDKRLRNIPQARSAYSRVPPTSPNYAEAQKRLARS